MASFEKILVINKEEKHDLSEVWVKRIDFIAFQSVSFRSDEDRLKWLDSTEILMEDLELMLTLPCHEFWSQFVFDPSSSRCLDSYLKNAPREFDLGISDPAVLERINQLHGLFFKIFLRLMTCKEFKEKIGSAELYGEILYEKYILDIPKLIDICVLFGANNENLTKKMVENVFACQPKYLEDLKSAVIGISKVFDDLVEKTNQMYSRVVAGGSHPDLLEMCLFASDLCHSLYSFLNAYNPAGVTFHLSDFYVKLFLFYDEVLLRLLDQLESLDSDPEYGELVKTAYKRLCIAQEHCVKIFRIILFSSTLDQYMKNKKSEEYVQSFCDTLIEHLGESRFMAQYEDLYPFSKDLELLHQQNIHVDDMRMNFIRDGLSAASLENRKEFTSDNVCEETNSDFPSFNLQDAPSFSEINGAAAVPLSSSLLSIKEMFPHLDHSFIQACLNHYRTTEDVINALLEDNLHPSLQQKTGLPQQPSENSSLLSQRQNIYDHDEFDVFNKISVDTSKIHRGKKELNVKEETNDYKAKIKELVNNLSLEDEGQTDSNQALYDDEYDDTYDVNDVGAADADESLELLGRKMVVPKALGGQLTEDLSEEEGNDTKEPTEIDRKQGNDRTFYNSDPNKASKPHYDVKGRAKGQGQTKEVLHNREFKSENKARMANHNRKSGHRYKMSKGMF